MINYQKSIPHFPGCAFMINMISIAIILVAVSNPINAVADGYCAKKLAFIEQVFDNRDNFTKDEMLEATEKQWHDTGRGYPWYLVVEMKHMINDAYRKNVDGDYRATSKERLLSQEGANCVYYGF